MNQTIRIINFEEYNPRADRKRHQWFRMNNDVVRSEKLDELEPDQKWFFVFLLAHANSKQSDTINYNLPYFEKYSGVPRKRIIGAIEILERNQAVSLQTLCDTERLPLDTGISSAGIDAEPIGADRGATNERTYVHAEQQEQQELGTGGTGSDSVDATSPFGEILKHKKVSGGIQHSWIETYQDQGWIEFELKKAITWTLVNKRRAPKSNYAKFFSSWLGRSWEHHRKTIKSVSTAGYTV